MSIKYGDAIEVLFRPPECWMEGPTQNIMSAFIKTNDHLIFPDRIVCAISGGADSDIMLDMAHKIDRLKKVRYVFYNTGLEMQATIDHVEELKEKYGIEIDVERPKKSIPAACKQFGQPFFSKKIAEMIERTIALNEQHSPEQKNFYSAHEVFHYVWHDDLKDTVRFCKDGIERDDINEWQANEAAAEIIMPYTVLIPLFVEACHNSERHGSAAIRDAKEKMETYFGVTARMVYMRLEALKYEISQFTKGVSIDSIEILSKRQQTAKGIRVDSYNYIESNIEIQEMFSQQYSNYLK